MFSNNNFRLYHENKIRQYYFVSHTSLYHIGMLGIKPSMTWKCPLTSVLPAAELCSVWRKINSLNNLINQEKTIAIVNCYSIVFSHVHVLTPSFGRDSNPCLVGTPYNLWATGQGGQKVSGGQLSLYIREMQTESWFTLYYVYIICWWCWDAGDRTLPPGNVLRPLYYLQGGRGCVWRTIISLYNRLSGKKRSL